MKKVLLLLALGLLASELRAHETDVRIAGVKDTTDKGNLEFKVQRQASRIYSTHPEQAEISEDLDLFINRRPLRIFRNVPSGRLAPAEQEELLANGKAWAAAIERAGGEAEYKKLLPKLNRLKAVFMGQPSDATKKPLLDYIVANKLFWTKPIDLTQERIKQAQASGKAITVLQVPVTDKAEIEAELDRWMAKR